MPLTLKECRSWHYQLQGDVDPTIDADLLVVDIDYEKKIEDLKIKPNGEDRIVLAYLSIGESEDYRDYWKKMPKDINMGENPDWKGNYTVFFWDELWQQIIDERIAEAGLRGFSGIYLDKADVYQDIQRLYPKNVPKHEDIRLLMVKFIKRICDVAKRDNMLVVLQNAPELLGYKEVVNNIHGCGVEDLVFGEVVTGQRNDMLSTQWRHDMLKTSGLPVFVVEYLDDEDQNKIQVARRVVYQFGWPLIIESEDRELNGNPVEYFPT